MEFLEKRGYKGFIPLDSGGQGTVYLTSLKTTNQHVAIKVIPIKHTTSATVRTAATAAGADAAQLDIKLRNELTISRSLRHPNCIHVMDAFRTRTKVYIVMDFLPNGAIGSYVRRNGPLCEWEVKCWFPAIVSAVRYLHDHRIAHRDLKLDNVLFDDYWNPVLVDFGFSSFLVHHPDERYVPPEALVTNYPGTRSHNAPELISRTPHDAYRADIWALGVILFIMIAQVYPFNRRHTKQEMLDQQTRRAYSLPEGIAAQLTREFHDLLARLLEPVAANRPSINQVWAHPWIPTICREDEWLERERTLEPEE